MKGLKVWSKSNLLNILLLVVLGTFLYKQLPVYLNSQANTKKSLVNFVAFDLQGNSVSLPASATKSVFIFWATWCGPCHLQLNQMQRAVESGKIDPEKIFAVSLGESLIEVRKFAESRAYAFELYAVPDQGSWEKLSILATPSILFVDAEGRITDFKAGFSPLGSVLAVNFLKTQ